MGGATGSVPVTVEVRGDGRAPERKHWQLAEEVPVNLFYNGRPHVVMMATPADLEDFAVGFSLSEGVLASSGLIESIKVQEVEGGVVIDVATKGRVEIARDRQARAMEGRTGCGICGLQRLDQVVRSVNAVHAGFRLSADAVGRAFQHLPAAQTMNRLNRSVHGAAWCSAEGEVLLIREDVGRHTALDKLIGALARAGVDPRGGFCVMTSRCSFELVQKAAMYGIPYLATVSAPTSLALQLARRAGMGLATLSPDGVVMFDGEDADATTRAEPQE